MFFFFFLNFFLSLWGHHIIFLIFSQLQTPPHLPHQFHQYHYHHYYHNQQHFMFQTNLHSLVEDHYFYLGKNNSIIFPTPLAILKNYLQIHF